ncbi:DUF2637 domain-containing protein [Microbacterium lacticum]
MEQRVVGRRWAVYSSASGTVMIAGGAFWLSFVALADLARRSGIEREQWVWPLLVDGLIVVATVSAVALDRRAGSWYPWALLVAGALVSVTANALHAVVAADANIPVVLAAAVAAVPPLVLLASTHLTVVLIRSTRITTTPPPAEAPVSGLPETGITPEALAPSPATETNDPPDEEQGEASAPVGAGSGRRERAARLREAGWSNKQIARELDVHPSTVGRWLPQPPAAAEPKGSESSESSGPQEVGIPPEPDEEEPS